MKEKDKKAIKLLEGVIANIKAGSWKVVYVRMLRNEGGKTNKILVMNKELE
jgi:hypothetical protein